MSLRQRFRANAWKGLECARARGGGCGRRRQESELARGRELLSRGTAAADERAAGQGRGDGGVLLRLSGLQSVFSGVRPATREPAAERGSQLCRRVVQP